MSKHSIEIDVDYPDPEVEFRHYTKPSREGIQYIRSLPDHVVLEALKGSIGFTNKSYEYVHDFMTKANGESWINLFWLIARLAEVAYHRNLIGEAEFDRLTKY